MQKARLMVVRKEDRKTDLVFDLWHDRYDWSKAHNPVFLLLVYLRYRKEGPSINMAPTHAEFVANKIAALHTRNGWNNYPPYFDDQSSERANAPIYGNNRYGTPSPSGVPDLRRWHMAVWVPTAPAPVIILGSGQHPKNTQHVDEVIASQHKARTTPATQLSTSGGDKKLLTDRPSDT
ncbi:hypothetical protein K461DRAFT_316013 [Myriangium duriaei CBS 260.36]|uniref:Uncharacterized protein n=1 Tax=Myriangium duriaei CBS 260.36 TaxID=1168546 RepID=A0A9P4IVB0_9PEZI|nr:hypothetical protein K461DRAFT_316013 [Myriangium duriaei CBS 260.36]